VYEIIRRSPVRNPGHNVNFARFHLFNHLLKVVSSGISAAQDGHFMAMEIRIMKRHVSGEQADENQLAAMRHVSERVAHGLRIPRAVENQRGQFPREEPAELAWGVAGCIDATPDPQGLTTKLKSLLLDIHHNEFGSSLSRELDDRKADRPGPYNQCRFSTLRGGSPNGMCSHTQHFNKRQLIQRERFGFMQLWDRNRDSLAHSAINVHA